MIKSTWLTLLVQNFYSFAVFFIATKIWRKKYQDMIQDDKAAAVAQWLRAVACKRKVKRSNPGLDRPKLLKQVVAAALQTLSPSSVIVTSPNEWKILEWDEKLQTIKPGKLEHDGHIYIFWFSRTIQHNFNV